MSDNDWLKYNASEYTVNGVTYRNLEAQVLKNKEDIEAIDVSGLEDDVEQLQTDVAGKQDKLTAGSNISISAENEISATDTTYSAGSGISISADNVISNDEVGIPSGGTTGQVLEKASNDDYDSAWGTIHQIPSGGTTGQALCKTSGTNYDVSWQTVSGGGGLTANQLQTTLSDSGWGSAGGGTYYVQNLTVSGMTASAPVWASFEASDPDSKADFETYGIYVMAQNSDIVTFRTTGYTLPARDIDVVIVWLT